MVDCSFEISKMTTPETHWVLDCKKRYSEDAVLQWRFRLVVEASVQLPST